MNKLSAATLLTILATTSVQAANLDSINLLSQSQFALLTEDLGAALSYKPLTPAEPLGITGFDLGVQVTYTQLQTSSVYKLATSSGDVNFFLPQIHAYKGLPLDLDIGVSYAAIPDSNIKLVGAELRYAILAGGTAQPAIGARLSYTSLQGVSQLDLNTTGLDISISKGFAFATPYAGVGSVWVSSSPESTIPLNKEEVRLNKYYLGINLNLAIINIAIEGDRTGDATSYGVKLGWRF